MPETLRIANDVNWGIILEKVKSNIKTGKEKPVNVKIDIDGLEHKRHEALISIAKNCKLKKVKVKNTFSAGSSHSKFLSALAQNQNAKNILLDVTGNEFDDDCVEALERLLEQKAISTLILPATLKSDWIKRVLRCIDSNKIELQNLVIPDSLLTDASIDHLENILKKKKVKNSLVLNGCNTTSNIATQKERLNIASKGTFSIIRGKKELVTWEAGTEVPHLNEEHQLQRADSLLSITTSVKSKESGYGSCLTLESTGSSSRRNSGTLAQSTQQLSSGSRKAVGRVKAGAVSKLKKSLSSSRTSLNAFDEVSIKDVFKSEHLCQRSDSLLSTGSSVKSKESGYGSCSTLESTGSSSRRNSGTLVQSKKSLSSSRTSLNAFDEVSIKDVFKSAYTKRLTETAEAIKIQKGDLDLREESDHEIHLSEQASKPEDELVPPDDSEDFGQADDPITPKDNIDSDIKPQESEDIVITETVTMRMGISKSNASELIRSSEVIEDEMPTEDAGSMLNAQSTNTADNEDIVKPLKDMQCSEVVKNQPDDHTLILLATLDAPSDNKPLEVKASNVTVSTATTTQLHAKVEFSLSEDVATTTKNIGKLPKPTTESFNTVSSFARSKNSDELKQLGTPDTATSRLMNYFIATRKEERKTSTQTDCKGETSLSDVKDKMPDGHFLKTNNEILYTDNLTTEHHTAQQSFIQHDVEREIPSSEGLKDEIPIEAADNLPNAPPKGDLLVVQDCTKSLKTELASGKVDKEPITYATTALPDQSTFRERDRAENPISEEEEEVEDSELDEDSTMIKPKSMSVQSTSTDIDEASYADQSEILNEKSERMEESGGNFLSISLNMPAFRTGHSTFGAATATDFRKFLNATIVGGIQSKYYSNNSSGIKGQQQYRIPRVGQGGHVASRRRLFEQKVSQQTGSAKAGPELSWQKKKSRFASSSVDPTRKLESFVDEPMNTDVPLAQETKPVPKHGKDGNVTMTGAEEVALDDADLHGKNTSSRDLQSDREAQVNRNYNDNVDEQNTGPVSRLIEVHRAKIERHNTPSSAASSPSTIRRSMKLRSTILDSTDAAVLSPGIPSFLSSSEDCSTFNQNRTYSETSVSEDEAENEGSDSTSSPALIKIDLEEPTTKEEAVAKGKNSKIRDILASSVFSHAFSNVIGPEGCEVPVHNCLVKFPSGTFQEKTKIDGKLEIDPSKCPPGKVLITPMLFLKSETQPQKSVTVKLTSWCINDGSEAGKGAKVSVLHLPEGKNEWDVIAMLPFEDETTFQFDTLDFSPFCVAIGEENCSQQKFLIEAYIYTNFHDNFFFVFHLNTPMIAEKLRNSHVDLSSRYNLKTLSVRANESIKAEITAENARFEYGDGNEFRVNEDFMTSKKYEIPAFITNKAMLPDTEWIFRCKIFHGSLIHQNYSFQYHLKRGKDTRQHVNATNLVVAQHTDIVQDGRNKTIVQGNATIIGQRNEVHRNGVNDPPTQRAANHNDGVLQPVLGANDPNVPNANECHNQPLVNDADPVLQPEHWALAQPEFDVLGPAELGRNRPLRDSCHSKPAPEADLNADQQRLRHRLTHEHPSQHAHPPHPQQELAHGNADRELGIPGYIFSALLLFVELVHLIIDLIRRLFR